MSTKGAFKEVCMKYPILIAIALLSATISLEAQQKAPAAGVRPAAAPVAKAYVTSKTRWGDPDLQGTWTSDDCIGTPMNRPANLGNKLYFTEKELADRESTIARQAENDKQEFAAADQRVGTGPPSHWGERARRPCKQTSLIVDPSNGRMPELLPEAKARHVP